jgi:hypothetical protein
VLGASVLVVLSAFAVTDAVAAQSASVTPHSVTHAETAADPLPVNATSTITNNDSGRCLDADANAIGANGTIVQLWDCNGSVEQQWQVISEPGGTGTYIGLRNADSGRCLDADTNTINKNGTTIQLWDCNSSAEQSWQVNPHAYDAFNLLNTDAPLAPMLDADSTTIGANGTKVQLWANQYDTNQMWTYHVVTVPVTPRIAVLKGGAPELKDNGLTTNWDSAIFPGGAGSRLEADGDMIGVLTTGGELWAKQGDLGEPWIDEGGDVAAFALDASAGRIGVILNDGNGTVWVKDGGTQGNWDKNEANQVTQLRLSGQWIGVVHDDGTAEIKNGTLDAGWVQQQTGAEDLEMDANSGRIGVILNDGNETLLAKDGGPASTTWDNEDNHVKVLRISGQWIGEVHDDGSAYVKNGLLNAGWGTAQAGGVADLALDYPSGCLGVVLADGKGTVWVKNGGTDGAWDKTEENGATVPGGLDLTSYQP